MAAKTAEDRLRYAKQYASVVLTTAGKGAKILSPLDLLQLSPNKRIHVMKAISCLARFTGQQDVWLAIRKRYGLQWSTGTEKIDAFTRFFDSSRDLDTLVSWLKEALAVLPSNYANFLRFCTCTGLRGSEAVEAVRLIKGLESFKTYYNPASQILQHYLYPAIFIRRTKACYVSVVNDQVVELALKIGQNLV